MFGIRLECVDCKTQYQIKKVKRLKRKLEKKCVYCGDTFKDTKSGVLTCSKNCSIKHRKKWFRKYNKAHKKEFRKYHQKYEKKKRELLKLDT